MPLPDSAPEHQASPEGRRSGGPKPEHAPLVVNPGTSQRLADAIRVAFRRFRRPPPGAWDLLLEMTRSLLAHSEEYLAEGVPYSVRRLAHRTGRSRGEVGRAFQWFQARGILVSRRYVEVKRRYFLYHVASPRSWIYDDDRPAPVLQAGDLAELVDARWPVPVIRFPKYWNAGVAGTPRRALDNSIPVSQDPETLLRARADSGTLRSRDRASRSCDRILAEKSADILHLDTWYVRSGAKRWSLPEAAGLAIDALHPELWDVAPTDPWSLPARLVGDVAAYLERLGQAAWTRDNVRVAIVRAVQRRAQLVADAEDDRRRAVEADEARRARAVLERLEQVCEALGPVERPAGVLAEVLAGAKRLRAGDVVELAIVEVLVEVLAAKVERLLEARQVLLDERRRSARARTERLEREALARAHAADRVADEAARADVPAVAAALADHAAALDVAAAELNRICAEPGPRLPLPAHARVLANARRAAALSSQQCARLAWRETERQRSTLLETTADYRAALDQARRGLADALRARDQAGEALAFLRRSEERRAGARRGRVPPEHDGHAPATDGDPTPEGDQKMSAPVGRLEKG